MSRRVRQRVGGVSSFIDPDEDPWANASAPPLSDLQRQKRKYGGLSALQIAGAVGALGAAYYGGPSSSSKRQRKMPRRRYYRRRRRRRYKRRYRNMLRRPRRRTIREIKWHNFTVAEKDADTFTSSTSYPFMTATIPQGVTANERIGRRCIVRKIKIRVLLRANTTPKPSMCRLIIGRATHASNNVAPTNSNLWEVATSPISWRNMNTRAQNKILKYKIIRYDPDAGHEERWLNITLRGWWPITWYTVDGNTYFGHFFYGFESDNTVATERPRFAMYARVFFHE